MHPNEIGGENPSKNKHVDCAEDKATEADPGKAGQGFKESVVELHPHC